MSWTLVDQGSAALNTAGGGTPFTFPGGAASAGDLLVVGMSSDTILASTPAGWSIAVSDVAQLGAFALWKQAVGGETSVTITTSGDHPTAISFMRYTGLAASSPLDVVATAHQTSTTASSTPAVTTTGLAGSGELGLAFACLGALQGANQVGISWTGGFTNRVDQNTGTFGTTDQHIFAADNQSVGPGALSPVASWTNATSNQTILVLAFKPSATGTVTLALNYTATAGMTTSLADEEHLALSFAATGSMSNAAAIETFLRTTFTATGSMSNALNVPTSGPVDPIATPVANQLLACLTAQMQQLPKPPAKTEIRYGAETGPLIGPNVDECCAGLAWVRVAGVYPSWDNFPAEDNTWLPCGPLAYAVVLEMGSAFCMPWSDSDESFDNLDPPSTDDWATAFTTGMQHQTLMRRAAACCFLPTQRRAVGQWLPLSVEGGCTGGTMQVIVSVPAPCGDC